MDTYRSVTSTIQWLVNEQKLKNGNLLTHATTSPRYPSIYAQNLTFLHVLDTSLGLRGVHA